MAANEGFLLNMARSITVSHIAVLTLMACIYSAKNEFLP